MQGTIMMAVVMMEVAVITIEGSKVLEMAWMLGLHEIAMWVPREVTMIP